jgi:hypothetical protein
MADTAAHLVDRVFAEIPARQWVLSLPFSFRYRLEFDEPLIRVLGMLISFIQSTVIFMSLSLSEPVTFVTDLAITVACIMFFMLIRKGTENRHSIHYMQWFFGTLGVATFLGGLGHLLLVYGGTVLLLFSWLLSGLAIFFFENQSLLLVSNYRLLMSLRAFLILKLVVFGIYTLSYRNFTGFEIHAALGLLVIVFVIHLINFLRYSASGSLLIIIGIVLTSLSALTHSMRFAISEQWFNHNDISHVIVLASLCAIYQGAIKKVK